MTRASGLRLRWMAVILPILPTVLILLMPVCVGALVVPSSESASQLLQQAHLIQHITNAKLQTTPAASSPTIFDAGQPTLTVAGLILPLIPDPFTVTAAVVLGLVLYAELEALAEQTKARQKRGANDDLRIPYDAAARLAYEASDKKTEYTDFKAKFEADAVADVVAKRKKKIPADPSTGIVTRLAFEARDKILESTGPKVASRMETSTSVDKDAKKKQQDTGIVVAKARALASAIARDKIDTSIPYDAAARLAYASSDKSMKYKDFKLKYEADAVADVKAKNVNVKIPYNAAARIAFEAEGYAGSIDFQKFEEMYVKRAVAKVTAKKKQRDASAAVAKAQKEAASAASVLQWLREAQQEAAAADEALRSLLKTGK